MLVLRPTDRLKFAMSYAPRQAKDSIYLAATTTNIIQHGRMSLGVCAAMLLPSGDARINR